MYVSIVASRPQLIYILWVFYVIMQSICHNFIDFIISRGLIPRNVFYFLQVNNHKRVGPRGTKYRWFNPYKFIFSVWKEIISRELDQGTLSPIGLIPGHFFHWLQGNNINRVASRVTKDHCNNPYKFILDVQKAIISRESTQGTLSPIGLIPRHFFTG